MALDIKDDLVSQLNPTGRITNSDDLEMAGLLMLWLISDNPPTVQQRALYGAGLGITAEEDGYITFEPFAYCWGAESNDRYSFLVIR